MSSEAAATSPPIPDPPAEHPASETIVMYEFGPFRVDVPGRHLLRDGNVVPLTAKVFDTLLVLVRNHDRPVMKEELIQAVWPGSFVSDDSLVQNISALRRALGDDSSQPRYIATLARRGYRFIAPTTAHTQDGDVKPPAATEAHQEARETPRVESAPAQRRLSVRWAVAAFAVGVALTAAVGTFARRTPAAEAPTSFRFQEPIPDGLILRGGAVLSPDGRQLAFTAQDDLGVSYVWVRALDAPEARRLPGTENAGGPFWSPDGKFIGFNSGGEIKRVGLEAGTVRVIVPTHRTRPLGVSWGANDTVLYADLGKIFSVPASGGKGTVLLDSTTAGAQGELRYPQWLNDAEHFIFYAGGNSALEQSGTHLATLGSGKAALLLPGYRATYSPPNYLLYVRDRTLMAQKFDPASARLDGAPMALPGNVSPSADLSTSAAGVLAITQSHGNERLVWLDRQGKPLSQIALQRQFSDIVLSPDNRQLLASVIEAGTWELWLIDLDRQVSTRVANDGTFPAWAPDGKRFAYTLVTAAGADLYLKSLAGGAADMPFLKTDELKSAQSWSPDNRFLVFSKYNTREQTSRDLWLLPVEGDRKPVPFIQTRANERDARVSPDGQYIAYTSDETGTPEVYVQTFPSPGMKVRISNGGGEQPDWRADGREVYYMSSDRRLTAVSLSANMVPSQPQPLFRLAPVGASRQYAPSRDGQRFVVLDWDVQQVPARVTVLTNWEALQKP